MHVVIVGGGVIGTSLAAALGDRAEVTLLEREELGAGTTAASMAMLHRQQVPVSDYDQRLRQFAREGYDSLDVSPTRIGSLYVAESEAFAAELRETAADLAERGIETRYLEPAEIADFGINPLGSRRRDPHARGGLLRPRRTSRTVRRTGARRRRRDPDRRRGDRRRAGGGRRRDRERQH